MTLPRLLPRASRPAVRPPPRSRSPGALRPTSGLAGLRRAARRARPSTRCSARPSRSAATHVPVTNLTKPGAEPHDLELTPQGRRPRSAGAALVVYREGPAAGRRRRPSPREAPDRGLDVAAAAKLDLDVHPGRVRGPAPGRGPGRPTRTSGSTRCATPPSPRPSPTGWRTVDPAHRGRLRAPTRRRSRHELAALDGEFRTGPGALRQHRELVTSHNAFGYLAQPLRHEPGGHHRALPRGRARGGRRSPASRRTSRSTTSARSTPRRCVSPAIADTVARETGARVADPRPARGPDQLLRRRRLLRCHALQPRGAARRTGLLVTGRAGGAPAPVLSLRSAAFGYGERAAVLRRRPWTCSPARSWRCSGPNGSGKSTLVRGLLGLNDHLRRPGVDCSAPRSPTSTSTPGSGYVPQRHTLSASVRATVEEVVAIGRLPHQGWFGRQNDRDRAVVREALELVGLADRAREDVSTLSGGQQRRVLIARALAGGAGRADHGRADGRRRHREPAGALAGAGPPGRPRHHHGHRHPRARPPCRASWAASCWSAPGGSPSTAPRPTSPGSRAPTPWPTTGTTTTRTAPGPRPRRWRRPPARSTVRRSPVPELLTYDFMQRALLAALLVGIAAPMVGVFLVQRRLSLIGDGMGHVALAGVAVGVLTGTAPVLTALVAAVAAAVAHRAGAGPRPHQRRRRAGGAVLRRHRRRGRHHLQVHRAAPRPTSRPTSSAPSRRPAAATCGSSPRSPSWSSPPRGLLRPRLFAVANDEEYARATGMPVTALNVTLAVLTAVTVVVAMRVVGLLLISALMIVPNAAAQLLARQLPLGDPRRRAHRGALERGRGRDLVLRRHPLRRHHRAARDRRLPASARPPRGCAAGCTPGTTRRPSGTSTSTDRAAATPSSRTTTTSTTCTTGTGTRRTAGHYDEHSPAGHDAPPEPSSAAGVRDDGRR